MPLFFNFRLEDPIIIIAADHDFTPVMADGVDESVALPVLEPGQRRVLIRGNGVKRSEGSKSKWRPRTLERAVILWAAPCTACAPPLVLFLFLSLTESTCLELGPDAYTHPSSCITRSPAPALSLSLSLATHAVVRSSSLLVSLSLTLTPCTDVRTRVNRILPPRRDWCSG
jgi:hypothetical protein